MKLVSAAKFSRAKQAIENARPYGAALDAMTTRLLSSAGDKAPSELLLARTEARTRLLVISADRGLCGSLNANLLKKALTWHDEAKSKRLSVNLELWGKKSRLVAARTGLNAGEVKEKVLEKPSYELALTKAREIIADYRSGKIDKFYVVYSKFINALSQEQVVEPFFPIQPKISESPLPENMTIVEPNLNEVLDSLLEKQLASKIYRALLDSAASEHGARMTAMDSATTNASEVIRKLTLQYNRARQAAITKELIEITSGAEAL
jgi:F-type H+-transporting ATPase subunit gamma